MNVHKNARLTPLGRERVVKQVLERLSTPAEAGASGGVGLGPAYKGLLRVGGGGAGGGSLPQDGLQVVVALSS